MPTIYSPPVPTYTALQTTNLDSSAATVTFSSIPSDYRDLVLVISGKPAGNFLIYLQFNGDTNNNYQGEQMSARGTNGVIHYVGGADNKIYVLQNAAVSGEQFSSTVDIYDYSASKHKTIMSKTTAKDTTDSTMMVQTNGGRWGSNNVINSIAVTAQLANFDAGTVLSLYGIKG